MGMVVLSSFGVVGCGVDWLRVAGLVFVGRSLVTFGGLPAALLGLLVRVVVRWPWFGGGFWGVVVP